MSVLFAPSGTTQWRISVPSAVVKDLGVAGVLGPRVNDCSNLIVASTTVCTWEIVKGNRCGNVPKEPMSMEPPAKQWDAVYDDGSRQSVTHDPLSK